MDRPALHVPATAESEDLINQVACALAGTADLSEVGSRPATGPLGHLRIAEYRSNNVVEVVRDTAGESADCLHTAGVLQASLQTRTFLFEMLPPHGVRDCVEGHAQ